VWYLQPTYLKHSQYELQVCSPGTNNLLPSTADTNILIRSTICYYMAHALLTSTQCICSLLQSYHISDLLKVPPTLYQTRCIHHRVHNRINVSKSEAINPVHIFIFNTLTHFNTILPSTCWVVYSSRNIAKMSHYPYHVCLKQQLRNCCILSFGWFPSAWILCAKVSEHSVCSIITGGVSRKNLQTLVNGFT
jgi:hypothetical protein